MLIVLVATEVADGRPGRDGFGKGGVHGAKLFGTVYDAPVDYGQDGFQVSNLGLGNGEVVVGEDGEVGVHAVFERPLDVLFLGEPGATRSVEAQRLLPAQLVILAVELQPADGFTTDEPVNGRPGIVTGDPRTVRTGSERNAHIHDFADGRRVAGGLGSVAVHEELSGVGHPGLDGNTAAEVFYALHLALLNGLGVVDDPADAAEPPVGLFVYLLENG